MPGLHGAAHTGTNDHIDGHNTIWNKLNYMITDWNLSYITLDLDHN